MYDQTAIRCALAICIQIGEPVLLWGKPGEGKSRMIESLAEQLGRPCEVVIGSIREATDFAGLPMRTDAGVSFVPPTWAVRCIDNPSSVVFLDELNTAAPATQAAMLRVVLDREVGEAQLPGEVSIVAAANPVEFAAGGEDLAAPLANRFVHLSWEASARSWVAGLIGGWKNPDEVPVVPDEYPTELNRWRALIAAFITARPALLRSIPDSIEDRGSAWPSPRTWDLLHRVLAACEASGAGVEVMYVLATGCVGEGPAFELMSFEKNLDLPDPEDLLADPASLKAHAGDDRLLATLTSVVAAIEAELTETRWQRGWDVLAVAADAGKPDVAAAVAEPLIDLRESSWAPPESVDVFVPILERAGLV